MGEAVGLEVAAAVAAAALADGVLAVAPGEGVVVAEAGLVVVVGGGAVVVGGGVVVLGAITGTVPLTIEAVIAAPLPSYKNTFERTMSLLEPATPITAKLILAREPCPLTGELLCPLIRIFPSVFGVEYFQEVTDIVVVPIRPDVTPPSPSLPVILSTSLL